MLNSLRQTVATPRKWPGRCSPSRTAGELLDVDPGLEAGRVDLLRGGREEDVDARLLGQRRVALLVARVGSEVGRVVELGRVDEDAGDDGVALLPRRARRARDGRRAARPWSGRVRPSRAAARARPGARRSARIVLTANAFVVSARVTYMRLELAAARRGSPRRARRRSPSRRARSAPSARSRSRSCGA